MNKTIRTLAPEIMRGRISPVTLTEEVLQRAERLNPTINSYITILRDRALREAEAAEGAIREGKYSGPLHGIPIAMKDIFYIKGVRCTAGSKILATNVANYDSLVVKRLIGAGAVLIGTTNLHEFASGVTNVNPFYGPVRNPWDTDRVSGGSSGGSAAAVAAEMTVAALGTDTSGSVRIPSSLCGVVGLKPTYGRISRVGVIPLSTSFDTVGTLTSCAWDAAALLQELAGYENADMTTEEVGVPNYLSELEVPLETPRLGVLRPYFLDDIDPQVVEVFSKFLDRMSRGTASISDVGMRKIEKVYEVWAAVRRSEATAFHEQWLSTMPEKYGEDVRKLLEKGREITAVQYINAQDSRPTLRGRLPTEDSFWLRGAARRAPASSPTGWKTQIDSKKSKTCLKSGPLEGIRVLELGTAVAGPLCAALLGDMGADVIKIEAPDHGDDSRRWGTTVKEESPYFVQYNRDKRSIALDIRREEGRAILLKLVKRSDVLIENFRPGTMKRLGLSYALLRRLNRKIVYCSVSGFGQTGPYSRLGGYDAIIQALSGLMSVTGEAKGPPLRVGVPITDILAALYAAFSVTLALFARDRTKGGQLIDVSLFESGVSAVSQWITISKLTGAPVRRFGNSYPLLAPYELFETKDRPIVVAVGNDEHWARLCRTIEREDLIADPRFRSNPDRILPANRKILIGILREALTKRPSDSWVGAFRDAGIPAGVINSIEDLAHDPQLRARGAFAEVKRSTLGKVEIVAALPKFSETPGRIRLPSPRLGEQTDGVLREVGFSRKEILGLRRSGTIR